MKILVVDDQDDAVGALAQSLRTMTSHEVVTAVGGPRALELSQQDGAPDVLITEVVLEGLDGFRLNESLREIRPELQTIYVTGYDMTEFADYLNGTPVFYKPADPGEIAALLPGAVVVRPVVGGHGRRSIHAAGKRPVAHGRTARRPAFTVFQAAASRRQTGVHRQARPV